MKQIIRLAESDLHRLVKESVKRILKEKKLAEEIGGTSTFSLNTPAGGPTDPTGQQHNHITAPGLEIDGDDESLKRKSPISNMGERV